MFLQGLNSGLAFIVSLAFDFYIFVLLLRFFLQKRYARYNNPLTQMVLKITNPLLKPLQRVVPGIKGYDLAIVLLVVILSLIEMYLLFWLQQGTLPHVVGVLLATVGAVLEKICDLYFFLVLIAVLMSWFPAMAASPAGEIVQLVAGPVMNFTRRILPPIAGLDFSPLALMIVLKLAEIVLFDPIILLGLKMAFGAPN